MRINPINVIKKLNTLINSKFRRQFQDADESLKDCEFAELLLQLVSEKVLRPSTIESIETYDTLWVEDDNDGINDITGVPIEDLQNEYEEMTETISDSQGSLYSPSNSSHPKSTSKKSTYWLEQEFPPSVRENI